MSFEDAKCGKDKTITRNGLVCRVVSEEEIKNLRARDRREYRKRTRWNVGARANILPFK